MNKVPNQKRTFSTISMLHFLKLIFRSLLFLAALVTYIHGRICKTVHPFAKVERMWNILLLIWIIFVIEMVLRFFPSNLESMGCQKQFPRNYQPSLQAAPENAAAYRNQSAKPALIVAVVWVALNAVIGGLYLSNFIDEGFLLLVCLTFSVCDMICILFFCPFQTWILKNKCCGSCRIYNWDYAMMFTPLVFVKSFYSWSILGCAIALLIRWEVTVYRHPERFSPVTNAYLSCAYCKERLCSSKKQLHQFWKRNKGLFTRNECDSKDTT